MTDVGHPFEYTATGILGDQRESMLTNELLLRKQLGRPLRRGYVNYPGNAYTYGRPNPPNNGGAQEALGTWAASGLHFPRSTMDGDVSKSAPAMPDRDFMALNREAVKKGMTTSSQQYQFRATHDIRRKITDDTGKASGSKTPGRRLPPSMVYGISTRPSTPIHDLIEHKYQDRWLAERRSADAAQKQQQKQAQQSASSDARVTLGKVNETRASQLRVYQVPVDQAPLWKMPKFSKNARASLSTFRTDKLRDTAYDHALSDNIGRQGIAKLGNYVDAKS